MTGQTDFQPPAAALADAARRSALRLKVKAIVDETIDQVGSYYGSSAAANLEFLSEDDFKCLLYARLHSKLIEQPEAELANQVALHSEIHFYRAETAGLKFRPDLSVWFRDGTRRRGHRFKWSLPREAVIALLEIKFIKGPNGTILTGINKDLVKLKELQRLNTVKDQEPVQTYMLCFSYDGSFRAEVEQLARTSAPVCVKFFAGGWGE